MTERKHPGHRRSSFDCVDVNPDVVPEIQMVPSKSLNMSLPPAMVSSVHHTS